MGRKHAGQYRAQMRWKYAATSLRDEAGQQKMNDPRLLLFDRLNFEL